MEPLQSLYYGFGHIAYSVAKADSKVQHEEKDKFHDIVVKGVKTHSIDFDYSDTIFHILKGEDMDAETTYEWGMEAIQAGKQYITEDKIKDFIRILNDVAAAFDGVTKEENEFIERFKQDIRDIKPAAQIS